MQSYITNARYTCGGQKLALHHHDMHQILYVEHGTAVITVNNKEYCLKKGALIFISHMESHSIDFVSEGYTRCEIRISPEILHVQEKDFRLYSILLNRPDEFSRIIYIDPDVQGAILKEIVREFNSAEPYREQMLSILLDKFLISVYRKFPDMFFVENMPSFETVYAIEQKLEKYIQDRHTLASLSDEFHLSKYYLSHVFKRVTGYSVMDYLKNVRLTRAKTLLTETELDISEITEECGFTDSSNFGRDFKRHTGLSPMEFRKKYR